MGGLTYDTPANGVRRGHGVEFSDWTLVKNYESISYSDESLQIQIAVEDLENSSCRCHLAGKRGVF